VKALKNMLHRGVAYVQLRMREAWYGVQRLQM
jgi:hypothetical protein